ncbi:transposase [Amphibacillus sediminis]|uniref:transposase n=1 Tax=Amphibacillus sediminis TaxID=360185 RepID=UPI00082E3A61|nr:transposase [Amphibacillus sediminis]
MVKYSEEFKVKLVTEYLYGNLGYKSLTKKYNMPSTSTFRMVNGLLEQEKHCQVNFIASYKT